ncbi:unnamed protein product, partial [Mesorhabditis belari]|uniref:Cationic amino acid transporter C-terminal domain-containing protein n=1 Tax=Mesorhabditis belari TaxID=2138241 RepID=A0AAF3FJH0_9BILA
MLSAAVVARAWSGYMNVLTDGVIKNFTIEHIGRLNVNIFAAEYLDVLAFLIAAIICILMATGAQGSTRFNNCNTVLNFIMISVVTVIAFTYADLKNWTAKTPDGSSSFFPYGISGTIAGASACFFSFIGFDGLATAGEEAKDPIKSIPRATFLCMGIVTSVYVLMSASLSLMMPYTEMDPEAAFVVAFKSKGSQVAVIAVTIGAICGMTGSMFGCLFALPRCVYAMAQDGLIFRCLSKVNEKTQVPVNAIAVFGLLTCIMAALFNVETLVDFLSLGTLMAYSIVAVCVILLRYEKEEQLDVNGLRSKILSKFSKDQNPRVSAALIILLFGFIGFDLCLISNFWSLFIGKFVAILCLFISILSLGWISLHKQSTLVLPFQVPLVPFLPALSLFLNTFMLLNLPYLAWVRFGVWIGIGLLIYFLYGIHHSVEEKRNKVKDLTENTVKYISE